MTRYAQELSASEYDDFTESNRGRFNDSEMCDEEEQSENTYPIHSNIRCICVTTEKHGDAVEAAEFISSCITKAKWLCAKEFYQNNCEEAIYRSDIFPLTNDSACFSHHSCNKESAMILNQSYTLPVHIILPIGGDGTLSEVVNGLCTGLTKTYECFQRYENGKIRQMYEFGLTLHNAQEIELKNGCRHSHDNSHSCNGTNAPEEFWEHLFVNELLAQNKEDTVGNNLKHATSKEILEFALLRYFLPPVLYMPAGTGADYAKMELCCKSACEVVQVIRGVEQYISSFIDNQIRILKKSVNKQQREVQKKLPTCSLLDSNVVHNPCFCAYEVDIGKVTLLENGRIRYFINECSLGMSVSVVERAERLKHNRFVNWLGGLMIFAVSSFIELILMKPKIIRVARLPIEVSPTLSSATTTYEWRLVSHKKNTECNSFSKTDYPEEEQHQTSKSGGSLNGISEATLSTEKNGSKVNTWAMHYRQECQSVMRNGVWFEHFHAINALPPYLLNTEYGLATFAGHIVPLHEDTSKIAEQSQLCEYTRKKKASNDLEKNVTYQDSSNGKAFASTETKESVNVKCIEAQHNKEEKCTMFLSSPRDVRAALDLPNTFWAKSNQCELCRNQLTKAVKCNGYTDYERCCCVNNCPCSCKNEACPSLDGSNLCNGTKHYTSKQSRNVKENSMNNDNESIKWFYLPSSTLCFANGRWYGGGLQVTPHGNPTDGLLSCTNWVTTFWPFIVRVLSLYNGKHVEWNHTSTFDGVRFIVDTIREDLEFGENCSNVKENPNKKRDCATIREELENSKNRNKKRIHSARSRYVPMSMEADGEIIGELPALIEIASVITFLVPREVQSFGTPVKGTTRAFSISKDRVNEPLTYQHCSSRKKPTLSRWIDKACRLFRFKTLMRSGTRQELYQVHEHNKESCKPFNEEYEELLNYNSINKVSNRKESVNCKLTKKHCKENKATHVVISNDDDDHVERECNNELINDYKSECINTISYGRYFLAKLFTRIKKIWNVKEWRSYPCVESDSEKAKTTTATPSQKVTTTKIHENMLEHQQLGKHQQISTIKGNTLSKIIGQACDVFRTRKRNQHEIPACSDHGSSNYDGKKCKIHQKCTQDNIHVVERSEKYSKNKEGYDLQR